MRFLRASVRAPRATSSTSSDRRGASRWCQSPRSRGGRRRGRSTPSRTRGRRAGRPARPARARCGSARAEALALAVGPGAEHLEVPVLLTGVALLGLAEHEEAGERPRAGLGQRPARRGARSASVGTRQCPAGPRSRRPRRRWSSTPCRRRGASRANAPRIVPMRVAGRFRRPISQRHTGSSWNASPRVVSIAGRSAASI